MDELDSALVRLLQQDARRTNRELASAVGIAPSTCLERVRSLRARGVITGYRAEVNLAAVDRGMQALIAVQVRPLSRKVIEGFTGYARTLPEVLSLFIVAGRDDFLLHVAVPDVEALHSFLMDRLSGRPEVLGFHSSVIYEHVRNEVVTPIR